MRIENKAGGAAGFHLPTLISVRWLAGFCVNCVIKQEEQLRQKWLTCQAMYNVKSVVLCCSIGI